jgi:50S ribosomal subunit-associated GTPase HflX
VALCGAAGAGKSTLFAALTNGPLLPPSWPPVAAGRGALGMAGRLRTEWSREVVLIDTPGLVRQPVSARWSVPADTLAECRAADLILQVVDASHPDAERRAREVAGALEVTGACPVVPVWTQTDRASRAAPVIAEWLVSGRTGSGCDRLGEFLRAVLRGHRPVRCDVRPGPGFPTQRECASRRRRDNEPFHTIHMGKQ